MNDLSDLYAEVVMDHNRRPRNFKKIEDPDRSAEGFNPLCGDQISLYLTMNGDDGIEDIGYVAAGCAISKAAASMMSEAVKGRSSDDAKKVIENFRLLLTKRVGRRLRLRDTWRPRDSGRRLQLPDAHQVRDAAGTYPGLCSRWGPEGNCFHGVALPTASEEVETCTYPSKSITA